MRTADRRIHALVVDDEASDRNFIRDIFVREGFDVEEAIDGREALEKIRKRNYEVIILDIMMPNVDGYEVMRYLKSQSKVLPCTVIVSRMNLKDMRVFFPGCELIQKPPNPEELATVARQLKRRAEEQPPSQPTR